MIKKKKANSNLKKYILIGFLIVAMLSFIIGFLLNKKPSNSTPVNSIDTTSPKTKNTNASGAQHNTDFESEGVLSFLEKETGNEIKTVSIEISDEESERDQGLMYRQSLTDGQAMLFVFKEEGYQAFWMKNTYIALDLIYVNYGKEIVSIAKNAQPRSTKSIPSEAPAMYVVEVPAGFSDAYGLKVGDKIQYAINGSTQ